MMQRIALGLGRRLCEYRSLVIPGMEASQSCAGSFFSTSVASNAQASVHEFDMRDIDSSFARMLLSQAESEQRKEQLTGDFMKIIEWLEDGTPDDDKEFDGKLKNMMRTCDRVTQNALCKDIPSTVEMANMQPALKDLIKELASVGEAGRIVDIAYKYVQLLNPTAEATKPMFIELVVPVSGPAAGVDAKKAMLMQDMKKRGRITANTKVSWTVTVDPAIMGGCIYRMGDVELDCSKRSLEAEFYAGLEAEGIARIA